MENGSFQERKQAKLDQIDFAADEFSFNSETAKSTAPHYSSSLDALLRQNDDLSARLKVTMQRLIQFEASNEEVIERNQQLTKLQANYQDQLLVWREKERLWLEKLEISEHKYVEMQEQKNQIQQLQNEIQRYRKYHEKVKQQVKPYIQQLKDYSKGLITEVRELHRELQEQEFELKRSQSKSIELQNRVSELSEELKSQLRASESSQSEMRVNHDLEVKSFQSQLRAFKEANIVLEAKAERIDQLLARQDELDNSLIEYKRRIEEMDRKHVEETEGLKQSLQMARNDLTKKNLWVETFIEKEARFHADHARAQNEIKTLNEQLSSVRFLWTEKSSEVEQMKSSLEALEKINRELSQKLLSFHSQPEL